MPTIRILFILLMTVMIGCKANRKEEAQGALTRASGSHSIPDAVVQFLMTSASSDFGAHHPPTPVDFRNIRIGYIASGNTELIYLLCGEFLSKESNTWIEFATIKTSGYEQYIGKTKYCEDATMVLTGNSLAAALKDKLAR